MLSFSLFIYSVPDVPDIGRYFLLRLQTSLSIFLIEPGSHLELEQKRASEEFPKRSAPFLAAFLVPDGFGVSGGRRRAAEEVYKRAAK